MSEKSKSKKIFERAQRIMPGGVNSPVRAFGNVGVSPVIAAEAQGPWVIDADGNRCLDYMGTWGPAILGHAHPDVLEAVQKTASKGLGFGLATEIELSLAEKIQDSFPSMEMMRMVNSGTEATMSAIRLARSFTGRSVVIKFEGGYHGHADFLLVKAGSGLATHHCREGSVEAHAAPSSEGVPQSIVGNTWTLPFNDLDTVERVLRKRGSEVAAVILEPVPGNMGVIPPNEGFLSGLKELTEDCGALLIFDEVITGFRIAQGGAQQRYNIKPDLTTLGKIIGGGLPVGAYGGRAEIMRRVSPLGGMYQAGTLSGNPVTVAAGLATLNHLTAWRDPKTNQNAYEYLETLGAQLEEGLNPLIKRHPQKLTLQRVGSMFTLFFSKGPIQNWEDVSKLDGSATGPFSRFFRALLSRGVLIPPSAYETSFISLAHTPELIAETIDNMLAAILEALEE